VAWASTNLHNLAHHPVAAMLVSMFVVTGNLLPELLVVAICFAVLERAVGAFRTAVVALTGQVVATLLTEYGADLGARLHLLAVTSAERPDVGVSYVMYAVLAASVLLLVGRARLVGVLAVGVCVLVPFLIAPGMTSTGHVLAVAVGAATMALMQRHGLPTRSTHSQSDDLGLVDLIRPRVQDHRRAGWARREGGSSGSFRRPGYGEPMAKELVTERLLLRPWTTDDATAALGSYGDQQSRAGWFRPWTGFPTRPRCDWYCNSGSPRMPVRHRRPGGGPSSCARTAA
jgi:hypothetical protein